MGDPLAVKRIVVTRSARQGSALAELLRQAGAEPILLPTIEIVPPEHWAPLDLAIQSVGQYDGVIFTSVNGVEFFFGRARELGVTPQRRPGAWVCAIGPATARELERHGWTPDVIPEQYVAESLVEALSRQRIAGQRILVPRAAVARDVIPVELAARGASVMLVEAYQTVRPPQSEALAAQLFPALPDGDQPDAVLFTSSSTARNFADLLGEPYRERLHGVLLAAIGPVTSATLRELGLPVTVEAREYTISGLVEALREHWRES